jgi:hypothetical protein
VYRELCVSSYLRLTTAGKTTLKRSSPSVGLNKVRYTLLTSLLRAAVSTPIPPPPPLIPLKEKLNVMDVDGGSEVRVAVTGFRRRGVRSKSIDAALLAACLFLATRLGLVFYPEDGGSKFLRNIGGFLSDYAALNPRR